jgi:hypothetical protein
LATNPQLYRPQPGYWGIKAMKIIGIFLLWFLLFAVCWPLALLALVLAPLVWLLSLPFRMLGVCLGATFALIKALLYLPARLLGGST